MKGLGHLISGRDFRYENISRALGYINIICPPPVSEILPTPLYYYSMCGHILAAHALWQLALVRAKLSVYVRRILRRPDMSALILAISGNDSHPIN